MHCKHQAWCLGSMKDIKPYTRQKSMTTQFRRNWISNPDGSILNHPHKDKWLEESQTNCNEEYTPPSSSAKKILQEQENVEGFELCESSRKVQCGHVLQCTSPGHIHCRCGAQLLPAQDDRAQQQVLRPPVERFDFYDFADVSHQSDAHHPNHMQMTVEPQRTAQHVCLLLTA